MEPHSQNLEVLVAKGRKYFVAALSWFLVFSWSTVEAGRPMVLHKSHLE